MDHIPGPIIAMVSPRLPSVITASELPEKANNIQISTTAIVIPAAGVQSPSSRSTPAIAAIK